MKFDHLRARLAAVLLADLTPLRWTLGWVAILLAAGLFLTSTTTENYSAINRFSDRQAWGAMFGIYGACHIAGCLTNQPKFVAYGCGVFGLWLWSYLFLSFTTFDPTPVQATEIMLALPIIIETWLLAEEIFKRKAGAAQ